MEVSSPSVDIEYRSEETTEMTRDEKIIRNKVGVLELAKRERQGVHPIAQRYHADANVVLDAMARRPVP